MRRISPILLAVIFLICVVVIGILSVRIFAAAKKPAATTAPQEVAKAVEIPALSPTPAPTQIPASPTPILSTATPLQPTAIPATEISAPTPVPVPIDHINVYLIALEDDGKSGKKIGCGDSVVPVTLNITPTVAVLHTSLNKLLSMKHRTYGDSGLYNALYQSNLSLDGLSLKDGEAVIRLKGTLMLGGECDDPRVAAMIEETALQFSTVKKVTVYLNDRLLNDILSEK